MIAFILSDKLNLDKESIIYYDKCIKIDPKHIQSYIFKAKILSQKLKQFQNALDVQDQCIKLEPLEFHHYFQKASILSENLKQYEEAIMVLKQFKKLQPKCFDSYEQIGKKHLQSQALIYEIKLKNQKLAIKVYDKYIRRQDKNHFLSHFKKAQLMSEKQGKYGDSVRAYNECIRIDPKHFQSYFNKALILSEKQQEYQKAIDTYDECIKLEKDNQLVYQMKGKTLSKMNSLIEARNCYEIALQISPLNDEVKQLLAQVAILNNIIKKVIYFR